MRFRVSHFTPISRFTFHVSRFTFDVSRLASQLSAGGPASGVDVLDAGIRGLAVVTVLVLSLLGYGRMRPSPDGMSADPVVVASGLIVYNLLVVVVLGVPWRRAPGFILFSLDWLVVSTAVLLTGGFFSPFLLLYYALVIGAALRVGLYRSLLLVAGCALVYAALSTGRPTPVDAVHLPVLAVGITSLLMVAVTAVFMKRALETEARRVEVEEQTARQLRLLNDLTRLVLSGSPNLESVMRSVAAVSSQALQADSGLVVLFEAPSPGEAGYREAQGAPDPLIVSDREPDPQRLSSHESRVAERAVRTQAPVLVQDPPGETPLPSAGRFPGLERGGQGVRKVACVPLLLRGEVIGALFVGRYAPRPFGETEVSLLTAIGQQMAVAVRLARLYDMERERAARSEERERLERDLLSMVSHELRTPLTSIKTCVSALNNIERPGAREESRMQKTVGSDHQPLSALYPPEAETRLLQNIGRSTDRLIVLVNELLDMARLRAGRVSLNLQQLNMGEVAQEMAAQVKPLLDARGQTLGLDLPEAHASRWEMLNVLADRRRIEQVLLNLLSNANKYTPQGGRITLGATPRDGHVKVFVRDDGPGIPPAEQAHIFEKFYQASTSVEPGGKRPDGTGLGLAIAHSIVGLHGGQIGVQSRPGRGSTFYFVLPGIGDRPAGRPDPRSPIPDPQKL